MQVQQTFEAENYAIVGGIAAPRAFQIGQSAHAFRILSDTLYSDKKLAVAREIICNAVDAHTAAGKTDVSIEITLNVNELKIQDFGLGIPDDRIVDIYATYFGSNKQADDRQTGGFGLGSKAPFAYTDHFSVVSCHEGTKTVYALHIDDEDNGGAPAVRPMGALATTETGVTVTVPLADAADQETFEALIRKLVREGGMVAKLNGELLESLDLSGLRKNGFGMMSSDRYSKVEVLYANVLYKLSKNAGLINYDTLSAWVPNNTRIILSAPPSSISVTPSREALSLDQKSLKVINKLIDKTIRSVSAYDKYAAKKVVEPFVKRATRYSLGDCVYLRLSSPVVRGVITDPKEIAVVKKQVVFVHEGYQAVTTVRNALYRKTGYRDLKRNPHDDLNTVVGKALTKDMMRIARKFDLSDRVFHRHSDTSWLTRVAGKFKPVLSVGNTLIYLAKTRVEVDDDKERGFHIISPKMTEELAERIGAYAKKFGLSVEFVEAPEFYGPWLPKAPPPPPRKLLALELTGTTYVNRAGTLIKLGKKELDEPKSYIFAPEHQAKKTDKHVRYVKMPQHWHMEGLDKKLADLFPDVAIATSKDDLKVVAKNNTPRLCDLILKEALAKIKRPSKYDKHYAFMAITASEQWYPRGNNYSWRLAEIMLKHSRETACAAWNIPFRKDEKADRAWAFWQTASGVMRWVHQMSFDKQTEEHVAWRDAQKKFNEALIKFAPIPKRGDPDYDYVKTTIKHLEFFGEMMGWNASSELLRKNAKRFLKLIKYNNTILDEDTTNTQKETESE